MVHTPLAYGSSPRARGTQRWSRKVSGDRRFIPARAGNTCRSIAPSCRHTVRPRARGEHYLGVTGWPFAAGSSPRARGTREEGRGATVRPRFIPARAGNTCSDQSPDPAHSVHPRARGEHPDQEAGDRRGDGSSPRARGTHGRERLLVEGGRFIPARAGNTHAQCVTMAERTVHPRARGEHGTAFRVIIPSGGSSPRARGTLLARLGGAPPHRFIPARAGNTKPPSVGTASRTVHPRARGEHVETVKPRKRIRGSSPRARGTLFRGKPSLPIG